MNETRGQPSRNFMGEDEWHDFTLGLKFIARDLTILHTCGQRVDGSWRSFGDIWADTLSNAVPPLHEQGRDHRRRPECQARAGPAGCGRVRRGRGRNATVR